MPMTTATVQELADRVEIEQLMARYARALDAHDADQIRALYAPTFIADYESVSGIPARPVSSAAFARMVAAGLGPLQTQHLIGSTLITVRGDDASGSFYALVHHWKRGPAGEEAYVQWGGYDVEFRRLDGGWRIVRQRQTLTRTLGDPNLLGLTDPHVVALMQDVFGSTAAPCA